MYNLLFFSIYAIFRLERSNLEADEKSVRQFWHSRVQNVVQSGENYRQ